MNILLINHYAGSHQHGMEYRPYQFALEWVKGGHNVTIVAASYSHVRFTQPQCLQAITTEEIQGIRYVWVRTPPYQGNGLRRIINMFSFSWQLYLNALPHPAPDVVMDSSTYPFTIYGAARIARKYGAKLIFEVHDLWPLTPMELGGYSRWHPFILLMQAAENYAYTHADAVVSMLPNALDYMVQHGLPPQRFYHIPNGINMAEWTTHGELPAEHQKLLSMLRQHGLRIVGYVGSHGISNALEVLLETARRLNNEQIAFVLVGQGPLKEQLQARAHDLPHVFFLPPVPKTCLPVLFHHMDLLYIGWNKNPLYRFGISPNKLLDYMMAAKPVIHSVEAANDLVAESQCGLSVPAEDPEAVATAIITLTQMSPADLEQMGQRGRDYVLAHHDYRVLAQKFLDLVYEQRT